MPRGSSSSTVALHGNITTCGVNSGCHVAVHPQQQPWQHYTCGVNSGCHVAVHPRQQPWQHYTCGVNSGCHVAVYPQQQPWQHYTCGVNSGCHVAVHPQQQPWQQDIRYCTWMSTVKSTWQLTHDIWMTANKNLEISHIQIVTKYILATSHT